MGKLLNPHELYLQPGGRDNGPPLRPDLLRPVQSLHSPPPLENLSHLGRCGGRPGWIEFHGGVQDRDRVKWNLQFDCAHS